MNTQTAVAISAERMFLRARRRSMVSGSYFVGSELDVSHHRGEQQREVEQRVQVEPQRGATVRIALQARSEPQEDPTEQAGGGCVEPVEQATSERQKRDRHEQDAVERDLAPR